MFFSKSKTSPFTSTTDVLRAGTYKQLCVPLVMSVLLISSVAHVTQAQEKPAPSLSLDDVVFTLDGKKYTNRDLATASVDFVNELERTPANKRREALIEIMINTALIAKESEKEKLNETDEYKNRLEQLKTRALRNIYIRKVLHPKITEELVQEYYVNLLARFEPETEIRARHILVETAEEAKSLIKELDGGKDFAELAQAKSTGPSAPNGGDLGFFGANQMVAPFQEAASKLKAGEYSKEPVKTQFGWHIIKVEETRDSPAPNYEQVAPDLRNKIFNDLFAEKVSELRKDAKIEIAPAPQAKAQ